MVFDPLDVIQVQVWAAIFLAEFNHVFAFLSVNLQDLRSEFSANAQLLNIVALHELPHFLIHLRQFNRALNFVGNFPDRIING